jgi:hypothetical protein
MNIKHRFKKTAIEIRYFFEKERVTPIHIYGLRRSGNHAIINWLLANLGQTSENEVMVKAGKYGFQVQRFGNAFHLNNVTGWKHMPLFTNTIRKVNKSKYNHLVISYEDASPEGQEKPENTFTIIRDLPSVVASRSSKIQQNAPIFGEMMKIDEDLLKNWIKLASHPNAIVFESWLQDKEYRDKISKKLRVEKNLDMTNLVSSAGGGSSFIGQKLDSKENLLNRSKQIGIPDFVEDWLKDEMVISLRKKHNYC